MLPWLIGNLIAMTIENFSAIDLIRNSDLLNRNTVSVLREAIRQNPYHQTLYLLLLKNLYKVHDSDFSSALKQYAPMVADRAVLFEMVEGMNYNIPIQKLEDDTIVADGDRTLLLIDNFLKGIPDTADGKSAKNDALDPLADYSAYLEQLPDYNTDSAQPLTITLQLSAVSAQPADTAVQPLPINKKGETDVPESTSPQLEDIGGNDDEFTVASIRQHLAEDDYMPLTDAGSDDAQKEQFYTEAMAGIYIKQQKFAQALEIIKVISAANPKKSVYFAEQIRYLELLIRINERKKQ